MYKTFNFDARELIDVAVKLEEEGYGFYKNLANLVSLKDVQKLFDFLASEEKVHKSKFKEMGKELATIDKHESYDGEYEDYIKSLINTHVINDLDPLIEKIKDNLQERKVIELAIRFEKDSIIAFNEFRKVMSDKHKKTIDQLIKEEKKHLVKLIQIKEGL
ncbi:ferritin-like domain-containing protein [Orenia marismortui]|uniref:ferritin-like domain-containing protein n=1 Tax=Orenia marismortui TaxID=46469 RepID=UPI00036A8865|nr:ferritin family protein [Orenia marismortui]